MRPATNVANECSRRLKRHGLRVNFRAADGLGTTASLFDGDEFVDDVHDTMSLGDSRAPSAVPSLAQSKIAVAKLMEEVAAQEKIPLIYRVPGLFLFPAWLSVYVAICFVTAKIHAQHETCEIAKAAVDVNYKSTQDLERVGSVYLLAIACFAVVLLMQCWSMIFEISPKKRVMESLILYINLVAFFTYCAHLYGWMAPVRDRSGKDIQIERYIEWMSDTPVMLFVISAVSVYVSTHV